MYAGSVSFHSCSTESHKCGGLKQYESVPLQVQGSEV